MAQTLGRLTKPLDLHVQHLGQAQQHMRSDWYGFELDPGYTSTCAKGSLVDLFSFSLLLLSPDISNGSCVDSAGSVTSTALLPFGQIFRSGWQVRQVAPRGCNPKPPKIPLPLWRNKQSRHQSHFFCMV